MNQVKLADALQKFCLSNLSVSSMDALRNWSSNEYVIVGTDDAVKIMKGCAGMPLAVFGDYDVDGQCASAILAKAANDSGLFSKVMIRVPRRHTEGFGMNMNMLNELGDEKWLIITCDNGIAAAEVVEEAKRRGHTIILTDHHEPRIGNDGKPLIPKADLVIDPKAGTSADFKDYCGAGIAYKIAEEMALAGLVSKKVLDESRVLAGIATICDVVPLQKENHAIARWMLENFTTSAPAGLLQLAADLWITNIQEGDIGFRIGPCMNAPGRLLDNGAMQSIALLMSQGHEREQSAFLREMNEDRKDQVAEALSQAEGILAKQDVHMPITVCNPDCGEGVIGIIAGRLTEKYAMPSIVFTESLKDPSIWKGSARSVKELSIKELLDMVYQKAPECLPKYGGHTQAAGLSVPKAHFETFRKIAEECALTFGYTPERKLPEADFVITEDQIDAAIRALDPFAPFGEGNPRPLFRIENFTVTPVGGKFINTIGDKGVKLQGKYAEAIAFDMTELAEGEYHAVNLLGYLGRSYFKGEERYQVEFIAIEDATPKATQSALTKRLALAGMK